MERIYLDYNATFPLCDAARASLRTFLETKIANPGSVHQEGQESRARLEAGRRTVLRALAPGRVTFTAGATEANNTVIAALGAGDVVVSSRLEHPSVIVPLKAAAERGASLRWVANDRAGQLDLDSITEALRGATFATFMAANNELGTINAIETIAQLCQATGTPLHVDAVQAFGKTAWRPSVGVTSATVSAHKLGGPVGVGALWTAPGHRIAPLFIGGHQERGARAGTENVVGAAAFAAVIDAEANWVSTSDPRDAFERTLVESIGAVVNGGGPRLPNTSNLSFPGLDAEELLMALDLAGVACSAGSACTAGSIDVSPVVEALGHDTARTRSALRFSFGPQQGLEVAERASAIVAGVVRRLGSR